MKNIFKEKPSDTEVKAYEDKLNYYLQAQNALIKILLKESPLIMYSINNDESKEDEYYWIDSVTYTTPDINIKIDYLFSDYPSLKKERYFDQQFAWNDARGIQDYVYTKLNKFKDGFRTDNGDSYWKLWDFVNKN